ncbi:Riboflavin biosynthesis protein RibF [bacterium HR17]|uniref:Riboflavin biosynthesis protein n=1 Tax=Candidatus Fervidibacter japonicus TaxID=2035412 RepID=A0A2H5XB73_9BACT|nr:Riboflavin biosynthesis protein RibF [bacterium HR17]
MQVYTDLSAVPTAERGISIGVFDGVHRGHRELVRVLREATERRRWRALVLTFANHPQEVLNPPPPPLLTTIEERLELLRETGADEVLVLPFTRDLSQFSAERFCREVLVDALGCRLLVVGHDFALGRQREGTVPRLQELGLMLGFEVTVAPTVLEGGEPVSSSRIRQSLLVGAVAAANALLGAPYRLRGVVVPGAGRGKRLGFPTVNLRVPANKLLPRHGIYAARFVAPMGTWGAAVYIGTRPTFGETQPVVEAHLLDFDGVIPLGTDATVQLLSFVRPDQYFERTEDLIAQMQADVAAVRERLSRDGY